MRKVNEIIIHCTATPEGRVVTLKEVDRWHRERGFDGIGYHYLIGLNGEVCTGRSLEKAGAHCAGRNAQSIGICYVGGLDKNRKSKDTRTLAQKVALERLVMHLVKTYNIKKVSGHNEYASKDCPCFDVGSWFNSLK